MVITNVIRNLILLIDMQLAHCERENKIFNMVYTILKNSKS